MLTKANISSAWNFLGDSTVLDSLKKTEHALHQRREQPLISWFCLLHEYDSNNQIIRCFWQKPSAVIEAGFTIQPSFPDVRDHPRDATLLHNKALHCAHRSGCLLTQRKRCCLLCQTTRTARAKDQRPAVAVFDIWLVLRTYGIRGPAMAAKQTPWKLTCPQQHW